MLSHYSVKKPFTVVVAVIAVIILGVISFLNMSTDLLPNLDLPYVVVMTAYPGASPEKVEASVTKPLENALATTGGLEKLNSTSNENYSLLVLQFAEETNLDSAMIQMSGTLDTVRASFPEGAGTPTLMRINPDMLPIMVSSVDLEGADPLTLSRFVEQVVLPALERVEGVASVTASGLVEETVRIELSQEKIDELNQKILAVIDEELADTEQELLDAQEKLDEGRDQLSSARRNQMNQLNEAEKQLEAGIDQVKQMAENPQAALAELEARKKELTAQQQKISAAVMEYIKLQETGEKLELQLSAANQALAQLEANQASLNPAEYEKQHAQAVAAIETVKGYQSEWEKGKTQADTAISTMYEQAFPGEDSSLASRQKLQKLADAAAAGIETIDQAIAQVHTAKEQLPELESQLAQVQEGKSALRRELNKAENQLDDAQEQLNEGRDQFETARNEAYRAAGMDGVVTASTISNILTAQNFSMPAGYLTGDDQGLLVKVGDTIGSLEELRGLVLFHIDQGDIGPVTLADVAEVSLADNAEKGYTRVNGNNGVLLVIEKQSLSSTAQVCKSLNEATESLMQRNEGLTIASLQDQGMYIGIVTDSVLNNLLLGGLLAILILALFLRNLRPTFVTAVSIPISVTFAVVLMYFSGVNLNVMSLAGLALGVGMLVDNSIVVIENIYRLRGEGLSAAKAAVEGAKQVAGAIISSTLTTVCVFLPIVFTTGLTRQLFTDMALTITYSLAASLLVALTLVPALASGMLRNSQQKPLKWFERFLAAYQRLLGFTLNHRAWVLILVVLLLAGSCYGAFSMGTAFIPDMDTPYMSVSMSMPEERTQQEARNMADRVMEAALTIDEVKTIGAMQGGGMMLGGGSGEDGISFYLVLDENKKRTNEAIRQDLLTATQELECEIQVQASTMDISMLTGSGISVKIKGRDLDVLQETAIQIGDLMRNTQGIGEVSDGSEDTAGELRLRVDKNKAMEYGLTTAQVYQSIALALARETDSISFTMDGKEYDSVVISPKAYDQASLLKYTFEAKVEDETVDVPLSTLVTVETAATPAAIHRDGQTRYMTVTGSIADGYNIGLVSREFSKAFNEYQPPEGYSIQVDGENEAINEALGDLLLMIALAVALIYLIMVAQFQSLLSPFIVLFTIPLAFTGGLLALLITGFEISIISLVGMLVLAGVVVNNGIVFVDCVNQLRLDGMEKRDALLQAGRMRIRPILMTALTTILGLLTMAFGVGMGAELLQPLAVVAIGGLTYATLLTLLVVPVLYDMMNKKPMKKRLEE